MLNQFVTRTLQIIRARAWKPTGLVLDDGTPEQLCMGDVETVVTRMNRKIARDILKEEGVDLRGCTVTWEVEHIATYGMPVETFFAGSMQVTRAANGTITIAE